MSRQSVAITLAQAAQGLQDIGYPSGQLLHSDYTYASAGSSREAVQTIPLAAFAYEPPSYRSACFGVFVSDGETRAVEPYWSLGAPQLLEIRDTEVLRWKVTASPQAPQILETIRPEDLLPTIRNRSHEWGPGHILRARSIAFDQRPYQLDFYDTGLIPSIEAVVREKLDRQLREVLAVAQAVYQEMHADLVDHRGLFRLVFRLLAAKMLADRGYKTEWLEGDAQSVVSSVGKFYGEAHAQSRVLADRDTQDVVWHKILSSFHLQNISVEALAYVYENTLVDREQRRKLGTHRTLPEVAEYIVRELPFERLDPVHRRIYEPFAGHAALLIAALGRLRGLLPADTSHREQHEYFVRMLGGIELDTFALEVAKLSLILADFPNSDGWQLREGDVFTYPGLQTDLAASNVILCNPPFGDFSMQEREVYQGPLSTNKAADILLRVMQHPPDLLGFILPRVFIDGQSFRETRRALRGTYNEIDLLSLPEDAFEHSEVETVVLLASGRGSDRVKVRRSFVSPRDYQSFAHAGLVEREDSYEMARSDATLSPEFELNPLRDVWMALRGLPTLEEVADIHRGIEYNIPLKQRRHELVSEHARPGFAPGVVRVKGQLEPFFIAHHLFLNMNPDVMRYKAYQLPWSKPKVLVNAARASRGPWVLMAASDRTGLVAYQRFHGIWSTIEVPVEVLAAVLNGPVANAFVSTRRAGRDNRIQTLASIPIPRFTSEGARVILDLVANYQECRRVGISRPSSGEVQREINEILMRMDAEVLAAYELPPRMERKLLDYFSGFRRPVPVEFLGYYPMEFRPSLPWRLYVSGNIEQAGARRTLERMPTFDDPEISKVLEDISELVQ